jgi:hypothetical protein
LSGARQNSSGNQEGDRWDWDSKLIEEDRRENDRVAMAHHECQRAAHDSNTASGVRA